MLNKNAINILKRNINKNGIEINFKRRSENKYGEVDINADYFIVKKINI